MDTNATTSEATAALLRSHHNCFACGVASESGLGLRFEIDDCGVATADWQPSEYFQSYPDRLHGGIIATLLDCAMVHALFAKGIGGVTAEITIRYLQSVGWQQPLRVVGSFIKERHGLIMCQADIYQDGLHAAHATAKFMRIARSMK